MRPLKQREEGIRLNFEDHSSYSTIADKLKVSKDTVKSWVRRSNILVKEAQS